MKFSLILSGLSLVAAAKHASSFFEGRERIRYGYKSIEAFEEQDGTVNYIIRKDTDVEHWVCTRSLPPICFPPPLSEDAVDELKKLEGVRVDILEEYL